MGVPELCVWLRDCRINSFQWNHHSQRITWWSFCVKLHFGVARLNCHVVSLQFCTVVQWLVLSSHSRKVPGLSSPGAFLCGVHVLPVPVTYKLNVDSELPVGVNGCLCLCVSPVMAWWSVQGVPHLSASVSYKEICWFKSYFFSSPYNIPYSSIYLIQAVSFLCWHMNLLH